MEKVVIREVSEHEKSVCLQLWFAWNQTSLGKFSLGKALDKYSVQKEQVEHFYIETSIFFRLLKLAGFFLNLSFHSQKALLILGVFPI